MINMIRRRFLLSDFFHVFRQRKPFKNALMWCGVVGVRYTVLLGVRVWLAKKISISYAGLRLIWMSTPWWMMIIDYAPLYTLAADYEGNTPHGFFDQDIISLAYPQGRLPGSRPWSEIWSGVRVRAKDVFAIPLPICVLYWFVAVDKREHDDLPGNPKLTP